MLSQEIVNNLSHSSWIRAMFEEGEKLRKIHGKDNVFDFTLGNPDPEPPKEVKDALKNIVLDAQPGMHGYMSNAGYQDVRQKIADRISSDTGLSFSTDHILMTCGAAGGLNVVLRSILNPGEEVLILAPFFAEYIFYVSNHGGKTVIIPPSKDSFDPDLDALKNSITEKTKAIIINSPNNPSGHIYSEETLNKIFDILKSKEKQFNSTIFVLSDEPYVKLVYDDTDVPSILKLYDNSFVINSFSKSLSLPGERIGYIAVNPKMQDVDLVISCLAFCNRTLGFVNAPALFQKVIGAALDSSVDVNIYKERRDTLYNKLVSLGFSCIKPKGAFYLFPKSPIEDDVAFIKSAVKYNLLLVPGKGFGTPGYFRISYCVSLDTIKNSFPAFEALAKEYNLG
ncbi:pyridoxal phosphate-dependent aminotransferase [Acetivibrio clariflavus]|uniref:Aminotransferase n=1 Tax=Acetivibrio clariflavus (strain DSM 19732 / NBRC 101661 / EBR45) TaxID=720554 RepID=G8M0Q0_ACECE|nr:pyridoxal phosphate-dependent aminotransferase [Acetivibrio clariflavus]AEV69131.1 aspartate/tyrosine/aromatic aminotransferase [Acetivibrio clariflavus DSM 19732]HOP99268.1 pyridoxal phosphate-dependent aminotransferase [Acetivibrio clariflavus]HPU41295.1 pyridoxal phosphate-dependent aminotransferase [Acetivibrio clariflavus]